MKDEPTVDFGLDWIMKNVDGFLYRFKAVDGRDLVWQKWVRDKENPNLGRWEYCEEPEYKE